MSDEIREFWVYGECPECDWRCCCAEGARWPHCPECGTLVMPPEVNRDGATVRERGNGRQGVVMEGRRMAEQLALAEVRGWDVPASWGYG